MTLPLPYTVQDEEAQANFDIIKQAFPLGRRHLKVEPPNVVGAAGQPAFQNSWVNFNTSDWRGARFWKDPTGLVHIEGVIALGTIGSAAFTLPAGHRPGRALMFATESSTGHGRLDIAATGEVIPKTGGNGFFSINATFKQEQ